MWLLQEIIESLKAKTLNLEGQVDSLTRANAALREQLDSKPITPRRLTFMGSFGMYLIFGAMNKIYVDIFLFCLGKTFIIFTHKLQAQRSPSLLPLHADFKTVKSVKTNNNKNDSREWRQISKQHSFSFIIQM